MEPKTIEGTWEQVARRASEFAGRRVRVTVLDERAVSTDAGSAEEAFKRDLLASGLVGRFPATSDLGTDEDDDAPVVVSGEPVSETILRERR